MNQYKNYSMNDIIFQGRNKSYGAYALRKDYNQNISIATIGTLSLFLLLMLFKGNLAGANQEFIPKPPEKSVVVEESEVDIDLPKQAATPPPARNTPQVSTINYSSVRVVENTTPNTIDPISNNDAFNANAAISTSNTQGADGLNTLSPSDGSGTIDRAPDPAPAPVVETNQIHNFVQEMPEFQHGNVQKYILSKIVYPEIALENNIEGTVTAQVVIDQEGNVTDIKILKDIGGGCGKELTRVLSNMPKWKPGKQNDKKVKVRLTFPVKFKINQVR